MERSNKNIPEKTGVYLFKKKNKILYIGKAKNLKKRVGQYFQKQENLIIRDLLSQSDDIEFIITDDEKDALHLEYNLIQSYQPPFNIRLKDDKTFPYIEVSTSEKFPGIYYTRNLNSNNYYFGPVSNARKTKELIDVVTRIFKIRTCSERIFNKGVACLYFHIDRCSAPCIRNIHELEYKTNVSEAVEFLKGNRGKAKRRLERKMKLLADDLRFEEAGKVKEDLDIINGFVLESYISSELKTDYDVISVYSDEYDSFIILMSVKRGRVKRREFFSSRHPCST